MEVGVSGQSPSPRLPRGGQGQQSSAQLPSANQKSNLSTPFRRLMSLTRHGSTFYPGEDDESHLPPQDYRSLFILVGYLERETK